MNHPASEYSRYFKEDSQARICIRLSDKRDLEVNGLVRLIEGDRLTLELVGSEPVEEITAEPGSNVLITFWTGWSLCRCKAVLLQKVYGRRVCLRLAGQVNEKQTREYFRLDVSIPLCYSIPQQQIPASVHDEWVAARELMQGQASPSLAACPGGFKIVGWNGQGDVLPRPVNLSAGGLRFKTPEYLQPRTLMAISLFLPLVPPRIIHTVAETLRCTEIVLGHEKGHNYITAARFHLINDKDQETIIAFIFAEQRRQLSLRNDKRI